MPSRVTCAQMMESLTGSQRSVITLLASGLTRAEVARRRGITQQAVKKIVARAKKRISALLPARQLARMQVVPVEPRTVQVQSLSFCFPESI
jgi:DNA-directed RNA polymerase specialized sigma24 family protein